MKKIHLYIIAISILAVSCKDPEPVEIKNVEFKELKTIDSNTIEVNTVMSVYNPNTFGATVNEADLTIFINDKEVGRIVDIPEFSLPGKKESKFDLPIRLNAGIVKSAVRKEWVKLFTGKDLKLIIKGDVNAKMGMLSKKIPISHSEDVKELLKGLL